VGQGVSFRAAYSHRGAPVYRNLTVVPSIALRNVVLPAITSPGISAGSILVGDRGIWIGNGEISYTYRWLRCDVDGLNPVVLPGETGQTYETVNADIGHTLRFEVTALDVSALAVVASTTSQEIISGGVLPAFSAWARVADISIVGSLAPAGVFRLDVSLTTHANVGIHAKPNLDDLRVVDADGNLLPILPRSEGGDLIEDSGNWSFFNNPHVVFQHTPGGVNWMHVGSISGPGSPKVNSVNLDTGAILETALFSLLEKDDHDPVGLLVCQDGTLLGAFAKHTSESPAKIHVRRTSDPENPASWGAEFQGRGSPPATGANAYPRPVQFANGRMMTFFRNDDISGGGAPASRATSFVYSDLNGVSGSWSASVGVVENGTQRPYVNLTYNAALDLVDLIFVEGHPRDVLTSVWHMTLDADGNVRRTNGALIGNVIAGGPVNFSQATLVYAYSAATGLTWAWDVVRDPADATKINAVFVRMPTLADHRYMYARWSGSAWTVAEIAPAGHSIYPAGAASAEPHYTGGVFLDRKDPKIVYCSREVGARQFWRLWRYSTTNYTSFAGTEITPGQINKNLRPVSPINPTVITPASRAPDVVWMSGAYTDFRDVATGIRRYPPGAGTVIARSVSVLVPALAGANTTLRLYYGNPAAASVTADSIDDLVPVTTPGIYSISAGGPNV
jgi:hypothetical protein